MASFLVFFLTALFVAAQMWGYLRWSFWGAPTSTLQCVAFLATFVMAVAAYLSLFRLRAGLVLGLLAALAVWSYFGPAVVMTLGAGQALSVPALPAMALLAIATIYSIAGIAGAGRLLSPPLAGWLFPATTSTEAKLAALMAASLVIACPFLAEWSWQPPRDVVGPNQRSALVVYFKTTATREEVNEFLSTVVGIPKPEQGPGATELLPEIAGIALTDSPDGREAYAIDLWPSVTEAQRKALKAKIERSPIVYLVLEDVIPAEVGPLPTPTR